MPIFEVGLAVPFYAVIPHYPIPIRNYNVAIFRGEAFIYDNNITIADFRCSAWTISDPPRKCSPVCFRRKLVSKKRCSDPLAVIAREAPSTFFFSVRLLSSSLACSRNVEPASLLYQIPAANQGTIQNYWKSISSRGDARRKSRSCGRQISRNERRTGTHPAPPTKSRLPC